jgi:hypothetical protein
MRCSKTFETKDAWKKHENSQHFHLEMWRCNNATSEAEECANVCYRLETFHRHLRTTHELDDDTVTIKTELCRMGRNAQGRFWCGFCTKLIDLKARGVDAWTSAILTIISLGVAASLSKGSFPVDRIRPKADGYEGDT